MLELRRFLDLDAYYRFIDQVAVEHPDIVTRIVLFEHGSYPVYALDITDPNADDARKQHILFTAMHSGIEYSGANTLLGLIRWLVSDYEDARRIRSTMLVRVVPVVNPSSYDSGRQEDQHVALNTRGNNGDQSLNGTEDPYSGPWTYAGVEDPHIHVEAAAIQRCIDELRPELYIDCHGVFYRGQNMVENTGISVFGMNRPFHSRFIDRMNEVAQAAGFYIDTSTDRQKNLPVRADARDAENGRKYATCADRLTPGVYAYHVYHTLALVMEVGDEQSGLIRCMKALDLCLEHWSGEAEPGVPVNRLYGEGFYSIHPGPGSMRERRDGRVFLWNHVNEFSFASLHPQRPGKELYMVLSRDTAKRLTGWSGPNVPVRMMSRYSSRFAGVCEAGVPEDSYFYPALSAEPITSRKLLDAGIARFRIGVRMPFSHIETCRISLNGEDVTARTLVGRYESFAVAFVDIEAALLDDDICIEIDYTFRKPKVDERVGAFLDF